MSALCHEQTHAPRQNLRLFDHLVGAGEQCRWDGKAERLGGGEIDDEIELDRLLDREISRLRAAHALVNVVEANLVNVNPGRMTIGQPRLSREPLLALNRRLPLLSM